MNSQLLEFSADALFFAIAAFLQFFFGLALLTRSRKDQATWVLAVLFIVNGCLSALQINSAPSGSNEYWAARNTFWLFDQLTNFLILFLAIIYPKPIRLLAKFPRAVPLGMALVFGVFAAYTIFTPFPGLHMSKILAPGSEISWHWLLAHLAKAANGLAFAVVIVRWAWILVRSESVISMNGFHLVFAAFAVRAANLHLQYSAGWLNPGNWPVHDVWTNVWIAETFNQITGAIRLLSVAFVVVLLVVGLMRRSSAKSSQIKIVLWFLAFGTVEGFLSQLTAFKWAGAVAFANYSVLGQVDTLLLRPALIWVAIARHQFLDGSIRGVRMAQGIVFAFAIPTSYAGLNTLPSIDSTPQFVVFAVSLTIASLLAVMARRPIERVIEPYGVSDGDGHSLVSLLNDHYRRGGTKFSDPAVIEAWVSELNLDHQRAGELIDLVHDAWHQGNSERWGVGEIVFGRYRILNDLGQGGEGSVFAARDLFAGQDVVLKMAKDAESQSAIAREARVMAKHDHRNVLSLVRIERLGGEVVLVLPHLKNGDLRKWIIDGRQVPGEIGIFSKSMLHGLRHLHRYNVIHGDLKPSNVLLDDNWNPVISDFGASQSAWGDLLVGQDMTKVRASTRYLAPERRMGSKPTVASDLFELGLLLLQGSTPYQPTTGKSPSKAQIGKAPKEIRGLVSALLQKIPTDRPLSAVDALKLLSQSLRKTSKQRPMPMTSPEVRD